MKVETPHVSLKRIGYESVFRVWKKIHPDPDTGAPIFVIGSPRSGTTVFAETLGKHPRLYNYAEAGKVWDPKNYDNPQADHHWTAEDLTASDARRLRHRFAYRRWLNRGKTLVNKQPRNSVRIDYIRAIFPQARFIHIIRDGRSVVSSILTRADNEPKRKEVPFWRFCKPPDWRNLTGDDVELAAKQWRGIVNYILSKRNALGKSYTEIKYEDFCERPNDELERILDFLEVDTDGDVLGRMLAVKLESQNYKFRQRFSESDVERINAIQRPLLEEFGYPL